MSNIFVISKYQPRRKGVLASFLAINLLLGAAFQGLPSAVAASKIYKTIDANGNVVYTDVAPAQREGEAELQVEELNTYRNPAPEPATLPTVKLSPEDDEEAEDDEIRYESVTLVSPGPDEAVRANGGNVSLTARVQPGLDRGHALRFYLDGQPVATVNGTQAALTAVDRGTHSARVAIVDDTGASLMESSSVTFHVLRFSVQNPAAQQQRAQRQQRQGPRTTGNVPSAPPTF